MGASCKILEFPKLMSTAPNPDPRSNEGGHDPHRHGNVAQIAVAGIAILALLVSAYNTYLTRRAQTIQSETEIFNLQVDKRIDLKLEPAIKEINDHLTGLNDHLNGLGQQVAELKGKIEQLDGDLRRTSRLQLDKLNAQINLGRQSKTRLDSKIFTDLNQDLIKISNSGDRLLATRAWDVAINLAQYRSTLNASEAPDATQAMPAGQFYVDFLFRKLPEAKSVRMGIFFIPGVPTVPGSRSALFLHIGDENKNISGAQYFIVEGIGVEITLDGYHIRNAIVRDAKIAYSGGPLIMENVIFVNCTFEIHHNDAGEKMASALTASAFATFSQKGA